MGRLLASLIADSQNGTTATLATSATLGPKVAESQKSQRVEVGSGLRGRLLILAIEESIAPELVNRLPAADVEACAVLPDDTLRAYVCALRDSDLRERGMVPEDEIAAIHCVRCGPVYAAPEVAKVLPVVDGLPTAIGCPWCRVQNRGAIPRPSVTP